MKTLAMLLAALSLAGGAALAGCGSSEDEDRRAREQQIQREREAAERRGAEERRAAKKRLAEEERARKLGELVERQREQDARRARRNLERKQKSGKNCPGGYEPTLDICFD